MVDKALPDKETLIQLREQGLTVHQIAERYNVTPQAVATMLKRLGIS